MSLPAGPTPALEADVEPRAVVTIRLEDSRRQRSAGQPVAALYVMVAADGRSAKVGALEKAARAEPRRREVDKHHPTQIPTPSAESAPIRLALVAELAGLTLGPPGAEFYERWAEVEHLESAMRLVLARRLGGLAAWSEWIHLIAPIPDHAWADHVRAAWDEVSTLGRA